MANSGIYIIINTLNNKCYIGQSVDINKRYNQHLRKLLCNKHKNLHLQAAWNIYGQSSFIFEVLESCKKDTKILTEAEQHWMDYFRFLGLRLYNTAPAAGSNLGIKWSKETREKISFGGKGNKNKLGKKCTEETKSKMSITNKGKGHKHTEETKIRISNTQKGKIISEGVRTKIAVANSKLLPKVIDEIRQLYKHSPYNQSDLAKIYDISHQHVSDIVNFKRRVK